MMRCHGALIEDAMRWIFRVIQSITGSELRWSLYLPVIRDKTRRRFHLGPWPSTPLSLCSSSGKLEMSDGSLVQTWIQIFYPENQKEKLKVDLDLSWLWIHMQINVCKWSLCFFRRVSVTHLRVCEEALRFTVHTVSVMNVQLTVGGESDVHSTSLFFSNLQ